MNKNIAINNYFIFNNRYVQHFAFWVFIFLFFTYPSIGKESMKENMLVTLIYLPSHIIRVYITLYVLIPKFLLKKRFIEFILILEVLIIIFILIGIYIRLELFPLIPINVNKTDFIILLFNGELISHMILGSVIAIKLWKVLNKNQISRYELEQKNIQSELKALKAQINPHFLFNTLNNLNTLVFKDQQLTHDSIIKLSGLLRYVLYETSERLVMLSDEINYIKNYIDLQKLRLKDQKMIQLNIKGNPESKRIAPLLLIQFIENTFKYVDKTTNKTPGISILIDIHDDLLYFETWNYFNSLKRDLKKEKIGIKSVKRRLELIYANKYNLDINTQENKFYVKLTIKF